jgi:lysine 6-dehydrogenase
MPIRPPQGNTTFDVLVVGAGMMGSAAAYDLAHSPGTGRILLADIDGERASRAASLIGPQVIAVTLDVSRFDAVLDLIRTVKVAVGATSYNHNLRLTEAAIQAGVHFCDLGGNMDVVYDQMKLDERASRAGITVIPNCGLAPGLACILGAGGTAAFSEVETIRLRVGGLPQHPRPPLNYQLVFSAEGLINEYLEPAEVIREGKVLQVDSMADLESLVFPPPFGTLEAFNTSGGISTLPQMMQGRVKTLDYKTIRYPGHCEKFKTLLDLGFASSEPIMAGQSVRTAREFFEELLRRKLPSTGPDVVLMRVTIIGTRNGIRQTLEYELIDYSDDSTGISAMMRTTAFPTTIIAQMIADGRIVRRGVAPPEQCVPVQPLIDELRKRNIIITERVS